MDCPFEDKEGEKAKYLSAWGRGQYPYIIADVYRNIKKGTGSIYLTEGEKKAISGFEHGLNVIGLPGNWGWKAPKKWELLPSLNELIKSGLDVILIWDSDAVLNKDFALSTIRFQEVLLEKKCNLKVVVLPQGRK